MKLFFVFHTIILLVGLVVVIVVGQDVTPEKTVFGDVYEIVGGSPAPPGRYSGFASYRSSPTRFCGGVLIHGDIILTSAECYIPSEVTVLGNSIRIEDGLILQVEESVTHPDYTFTTDFTIEYDFRLLRISVVLEDDWVAPYNSDGPEPIGGDIVTAVGFGRECTFCDTSTTLQEVDVETVDSDTCDDIYQGFLEPEIHMCTSNEDSGTCVGDEGGPLYNQDQIVVGVSSFGWQGCADGLFPGVYSRVSAGADWIYNTICDISASPPCDCTNTCAPITTPSAIPSTMPSPSPSLAPTFRPPTQPPVPTPVPTEAPTRPVIIFFPTAPPTPFTTPPTNLPTMSNTGTLPTSPPIGYDDGVNAQLANVIIAAVSGATFVMLSLIAMFL